MTGRRAVTKGADPRRRLLKLLARAARWFAPLLGFLLIGAAIWVLSRQLRDYRYADVVQQIQATSFSSILLALLLAALAYCVLVGYDFIALSYTGQALPLRKIALGSFVAHSMSHSLGFHMITAGSIRYRFWSAWGLSNAQIGRALGFASTSFVLGMLLVCGVVLLFEPPGAMALLHLPTAPLRLLGGVLVGAVGATLLWMRFGRGSLRLFGSEIHVPRARLALGHLLIAAFDWTISASIAFVLLPSGHGIGFLTFTGIFLFAVLAGAIGHAPGGVGVLESLMVVMLRPYLDPPSVLAPLIVYRLIYYVLPFILGLGLMIGHELSLEGARVSRVASAAVRWVPAVLPLALSILVFSAGTILLLSAAVTLNAGRLAALRTVVPLPAIELAHFASCILGAALLVYGWFLQSRSSRAHVVVSAVLAAATVASLLRGLVWEVVLLMSAALSIIVVSRQVFVRPGSLARLRLSATWITGIITVLAVMIWLGFFSFKNVEYSAGLWLQFSLEGDSARFARGAAGAVIFLLTTGAIRLWERRRERMRSSSYSRKRTRRMSY